MSLKATRIAGLENACMLRVRAILNGRLGLTKITQTILTISGTETRETANAQEVEPGQVVTTKGPRQGLE